MIKCVNICVYYFGLEIVMNSTCYISSIKVRIISIYKVIKLHNYKMKLYLSIDALGYTHLYKKKECTHLYN